MQRKSCGDLLLAMMGRGNKRKRTPSPENKKRLTPDNSTAPSRDDRENHRLQDNSTPSGTPLLSPTNNQVFNHQNKHPSTPTVPMMEISGNFVSGWRKANNEEIKISKHAQSAMIQTARLCNIPYEFVYLDTKVEGKDSQPATITTESSLLDSKIQSDQSKENCVSYEITEEDYSCLFDSSPTASPCPENRLDSSASQLLPPEDDDFLSNLDVDNLIAS